MPPLTLPLVLALAATWTALLQLVLARWRDLGPATVGLAALAVWAALPHPDEWVLAGIACAMTIAGIAWVRGGARGVGRPGLTGLVLGSATGLLAAEPLIAARLPVPPQDLRLGLAAAVGLLAVLLTGVALGRARWGFPPPRWTGEVSVGPTPTPEPASPSEEAAPPAEDQPGNAERST